MPPWLRRDPARPEASWLMDNETWGRGQHKHSQSRQEVERRSKDGKADRIFPLGRRKSSQRPKGQRSF